MVLSKVSPLLGAYLVLQHPNHCVAIVPKLQDLVLLQHQVSPYF